MKYLYTVNRVTDITLGSRWVVWVPNESQLQPRTYPETYCGGPLGVVCDECYQDGSKKKQIETRPVGLPLGGLTRVDINVKKMVSLLALQTVDSHHRFEKVGVYQSADMEPMTAKTRKLPLSSSFPRTRHSPPSSSSSPSAPLPPILHVFYPGIFQMNHSISVLGTFDPRHAGTLAVGCSSDGGSGWGRVWKPDSTS